MYVVKGVIKTNYLDLKYVTSVKVLLITSHTVAFKSHSVWFLVDLWTWKGTPLEVSLVSHCECPGYGWI